jgi:3-deoxy-D-manno-octulosonic acid kinase
MNPPAGYTWLAQRWRRAVVRDDLVPVLGAWLLDLPEQPPVGVTRMAAGRGSTFRLRLPDGTCAVVRLGRRGGLVGRIIRRWYAGRPRPWAELRTSIVARERGAPVPEVLGCAVVGWGIYRSAVVTAEIEGVTTAIDAIRAAATAEGRCAIARAAAAAVARLHAAGVIHHDLNLTNVLIGGAGAFIVDLDGARLPSRRCGVARRRNLVRLRRSARKLDPAAELIDASVVATFHAAYAERVVRCGS